MAILLKNAINKNFILIEKLIRKVGENYVKP